MGNGIAESAVRLLASTSKSLTWKRLSLVQEFLPKDVFNVDEAEFFLMPNQQRPSAYKANHVTEAEAARNVSPLCCVATRMVANF